MAPTANAKFGNAILEKKPCAGRLEGEMGQDVGEAFVEGTDEGRLGEAKGEQTNGQQTEAMMMIVEEAREEEEAASQHVQLVIQQQEQVILGEREETTTTAITMTVIREETAVPQDLEERATIHQSQDWQSPSIIQLCNNLEESRLDLDDKMGKLELACAKKDQEMLTLQQQVDNLLHQLDDERQVNFELARNKQELSSEIMELTKALFEEANGMVATEVKARSQLEKSITKLQLELEATRERLRLEQQQLTELRSRIAHDGAMEEFSEQQLYLQTSSSSTPPIESLIPERRLYSLLSCRYFGDLLPSRRFDSRVRRSGEAAEAWERIVSEIDQEDFDAFSAFLDRSLDLEDHAFLSHPFMHRIFEQDVAPCLKFDFKPRSFLKRLQSAMLANTCTVERRRVGGEGGGVPPRHSRSLSTSPMTTTETGGETATEAILSPSRPSSPLSDACGSGHMAEQPSRALRIRGIMSNFTASVSSLPDLHLSLYLSNNTQNLAGGHHSGGNITTNANTTSPNSTSPIPCFCALCGRKGNDQSSSAPAEAHTLPFRIRLHDSEPWMYIDGACQERLVAAGDFYTFMRHIRRGLYTQRPVVDMYFELLHYKRCMFYARCGHGATAFFIQNDFEQFLHKISALREAVVLPSDSRAGVTLREREKEGEEKEGEEGGF